MLSELEMNTEPEAYWFSALGSSELAPTITFWWRNVSAISCATMVDWCISRWRDLLPAETICSSPTAGTIRGGDGLLGAAHQRRRTTRSLDVGWRSFALAEQYPDDAWTPARIWPGTANGRSRWCRRSAIGKVSGADWIIFNADK